MVSCFQTCGRAPPIAVCVRKCLLIADEGTTARAERSRQFRRRYEDFLVVL